jgi:hypothetical protein
VILERLRLTPDELEAGTGWSLEPEGLCKEDRCVPLADGIASAGDVDVRAVAARLRMPLVHDERHRLWALGPESGGRALTSAHLPPITLPDVDGNPFDLASLRGQKIVVTAWASW